MTCKYKNGTENKTYSTGDHSYDRLAYLLPNLFPRALAEGHSNLHTPVYEIAYHKTKIL